MTRVGDGWNSMTLAWWFITIAAYRIAIKLMVLNASNVEMAHVTLGKKKSTQSLQLKINCQWARTLPCSGKIMVVGDQPPPT